MRRRSAGVMLAATALAAGGAPSALGASRTVTVDGWYPRALAFSGGRLLWTEAAPVRVDPARIAGSPAGAQPFTYWRAEVFRMSLDRTSTRFRGAPDTPVSVRESIGPMTPGVLAPDGAGGFVMAPAAASFPPPVIRCCDAADVETVVESDGRPGAPATLAAAWGSGRVRFVQTAPGGLVLRTADPDAGGASTATPLAAATAPGLVAASAGAVAWADPAAAAVLQVQRDGAGATPVALPGPALRVWGAPGLFAVAVRRGARVALVRVDEATPRPRVVWAGARVPAVGLGGGAVAVADGRRVLASRTGPLRLVATAHRAVDAVAVDGRRLAWVERGVRRGSRVGVIRLGRVR